MKRFALKRITALVLALVMTLSLLPMNVWAETQVFEGSTSRGAAGVFLFTELDETGKILTCSKNVMQDGQTITIPCATDAPEFVYLTVNKDEGLKVEDKIQETPIGTWHNAQDNLTNNVYKMDVPTKPADTKVVQYTIARTNSGGSEVYDEFTLVFDFTPIFTLEEDSKNVGDCGVRFFTVVDSTNKTLYCGDTVQQDGNGITVSCPKASNATVYMTADGELSVNGTKQDPAVSGKWMDGNRACKIYALTVPNPGNNSAVSHTVSHGNETITLVFDFTPVFTDSGKYDAERMYIFTGLVDGDTTDNDTTPTVLTCNPEVISSQWHDYGARLDVTINCYPTAPETVYFAVVEWETLTVNGATPIGKWNTGGRSYDVYSIVVPTSGKTTKYTGSWIMDNGNRNVEFNLTFDFTPVLTDAGYFNAGGVYLFTEKDANKLAYDNSISRRWDDNGVLCATVYCGPTDPNSASKTIYIAANQNDNLTIDGVEPTDFVGKWSREFVHETEGPLTEHCDVYALTVTPGSATTKEYTVVDSWTEDGEPMSNTVRLIFDFNTLPTKLWYEDYGDWTDEVIYIDRGTTRNMKLAVGTPIARTALTKTNCTKIETVGNIGTIAWSNDGTEILLDTSTASNQKGSIKVTYNGETYTLGVELNYWCLVWDNEGDYDSYKDIVSGFVYDWELYAERWSDESQGLVYPKINSNEYDLLAYDSVGTDRTSYFSWNNDGSVHFDARALKQENFPIVLIAKAKEGGCYYHLEIGETYLSDQDQSCWKTYTTNVVTEGDYTYGGYSTLTVQLTPEQAQFITLPEKLTANNELVITIHDPGIEVWREQMSQNIEGLAVFYHFDVLPGLMNGEIPMVKQVGGPLTVKEFFDWLYKEDYPTEDYFADRGNGNIYAKVFQDTDRIIIIPEESEIRTAWIWKYSDEIQLADSVNVKVVLADDVGSAVTLDSEAFYPAVDISRVEVQTTGLEELLRFEENDGKLAYENGILTYLYTGPTSDQEHENAFVTAVADNAVRSKAMDIDLLHQADGYFAYHLLTVNAPDGYTLKSMDGETEQAGSSSFEIYYAWEGLAMESTFTFVWVNGAGEEYVEQVTIETPSVDGTEWWMDHLYGGTVGLIDAERMLVTEFDENSGAEHKFSDGFAFVQFDNEAELDVNTIKDATIRIQAPKNNNNKLPVAYRSIWFEDASNDEPFYNTRMNGWIEKIEGQVESIDRLPLGKNNDTIETELKALLEQNIGDIQYYYSGDRGTRIIVVKWIYDLEAENDGAVYEYLRLDTSPYYCTVEAKVSTDVNGAVNKPTAEVEKNAVGHSNIYLETRIHPQEEKGGKYGQYFFELRLVDGEGNTFTEYHDKGYIIILPYSFMGEEWNYEMAKNLKEKPIINHYDKNFNLKENNGAIKGEYTERGIEFKVGDFSPFMLTWDETVKDNTGGTPGGYYPIVTPTTPVEKPADTKPTTPAQPVAPPAEVTVPVSGDENTINVEASVSGSTATIDKVDMTKLEGVIGDDVAVGTVTIDFSDLKSSEVIDTVEIPADVVKEIAEAVADPNNDAESLEIVLSDGASIEFDAAALAEKVSQAGGADITISIKQAVENVLSAAQQVAVGDRVAFDINVTSGGVHISDMGGKITIHAPYELRDGETAEGIVVYYVDDEGNQEKCETSYDSVKKRVNWKTDHLSVYMIAHEAPATDDAPAEDNAPADDATQNDSGNSVGLWIGVVLVVLVAAIVVLMILIKRKKA